MSCSKGGSDPDPDPTEPAQIEVEQSSITLGENEGKATINFTANCAWKATITSDVNSATPSVTPAEGKGDGSIHVTVDPDIAPASYEVTINGTKMVTIGGHSIQSTKTVKVTIFKMGDVETNVAEIRALLKGMNPTTTKTAVTAEIAAKTLTGVIVGRPEGQNAASGASYKYYNMIQDTKPAKESGLTINLNSAAEYSEGQIVQIPLTEAQVSTYGGVIQLSVSNNVTITKAGMFTVLPIKVTPAEFTSYESQLVTVLECQPTENEGSAWYNDANKGNTKFTNKNGEGFTVRVGSSAAFKDATIPSKSGSMTGIASQYNGTLQLLPRVEDDINLTAEKFEIESETVTIDKITAAGEYEVKNAVVAAVYAQGFLMTDASKAVILVYQGTGATVPAVGAVVEVKGAVVTYGGMLQFDKTSTVTDTGKTSTFDPGTPVVKTYADLKAFVASPKLEYVKYTGKLIKSGNYYNVQFDEGSDVIGSVQYPAAELNIDTYVDQYVDVTGYLIGVSSNKYANTMATKLDLNGNVVAISVANKNLSFEVAGGEKSTTFNVVNQGSNQVFGALSGTNADKYSFEITGSSVKVTSVANTTESAFSAVLTLSVKPSAGAAAVAEATINLSTAAPASGNAITLDRAKIEAIITDLPVNGYGSQNTSNESTFLTFTVDEVAFEACKLCKPTASGTSAAYDTVKALQMQGNATDAAKTSRIGNTAALAKLTKITVVTYNTNAANTPNFNIAVGASKVIGTDIPASMTNAADMTTSTETVGSVTKFTTVFNVPAGNSYFAIYKNTAGALYWSEITIE